MFFGELYVIRVAVEEKNTHSYIIGDWPVFLCYKKFAYQFTYTTVPYGWYSSTKQLVLQYQLLCTKIGTAI